LSPLEISTVDREIEFYGYTTNDGEERMYLLGDFKSVFDRMGVFQRPKRAQMIGGLRQKINDEVDKVLLDFEARDLGYYEDEGALFRLNTKIEEMLVSKLYRETINYSERITPTELDDFWAEHREDYFVPETRTGRLVVCATRASADKAFAAASDGMAWRDVLVKFGTDKDNKARAGKAEKIRGDSTGAIRDAMFALNEGEISAPFAIETGAFCVVSLESINEPYQVELMGITEQVGQRMKQIREEEAFQAALEKWKETISIVTYDENLEGLKSWRDLTIRPAPENVVPRNM